MIDGPLGQEIDDLYRSSGLERLSDTQRIALDRALGAWVPGLRVVLIDAGHAQYSGLDDHTFEAALARVAWHEWGHALSLDRSTSEDVAAGDNLLEIAPEGVAENVRMAGYRPRERTHELVAEIYALLMARRRRGHTDQPPWLADEIWSLIVRVTEWNP